MNGQGREFFSNGSCIAIEERSGEKEKEKEKEKENEKEKKKKKNEWARECVAIDLGTHTSFEQTEFGRAKNFEKTTKMNRRSARTRTGRAS